MPVLFFLVHGIIDIVIMMYRKKKWFVLLYMELTRAQVYNFVCFSF